MSVEQYDVKLHLEDENTCKLLSELKATLQALSLPKEFPKDNKSGLQTLLSKPNESWTGVDFAMLMQRMPQAMISQIIATATTSSISVQAMEIMHQLIERQIMLAEDARQRREEDVQAYQDHQQDENEHSLLTAASIQQSEQIQWQAYMQQLHAQQELMQIVQTLAEEQVKLEKLNVKVYKLEESINRKMDKIEIFYEKKDNIMERHQEISKGLKKIQKLHKLVKSKKATRYQQIRYIRAINKEKVKREHHNVKMHIHKLISRKHIKYGRRRNINKLLKSIKNLYLEEINLNSRKKSNTNETRIAHIHDQRLKKIEMLYDKLKRYGLHDETIEQEIKSLTNNMFFTINEQRQNQYGDQDLTQQLEECEQFVSKELPQEQLKLVAQYNKADTIQIELKSKIAKELFQHKKIKEGIAEKHAALEQQQVKIRKWKQRQQYHTLVDSENSTLSLSRDLLEQYYSEKSTNPYARFERLKKRTEAQHRLIHGKMHKLDYESKNQVAKSFGSRTLAAKVESQDTEASSSLLTQRSSMKHELVMKYLLEYGETQPKIKALISRKREVFCSEILEIAQEENIPFTPPDYAEFMELVNTRAATSHHFHDKTGSETQIQYQKAAKKSLDKFTKLNKHFEKPVKESSEKKSLQHQIYRFLRSREIPCDAPDLQERVNKYIIENKLLKQKSQSLSKNKVTMFGGSKRFSSTTSSEHISTPRRKE